MTKTKSAYSGGISQFHPVISIPENSKYNLVCTGCGTTYFDDRLKCATDNALLRANYRSKRLDLKNVQGMGRFHDWLPVNDLITTDSGPITYRSAELAAELGLKNLYISFNGYWPEKGAFIKTCSFKELEAFPTLSKSKNSGKARVRSSACNTARALSHGFSISL